MGCDLAADVWNMGQLIGGMIINRNTKALIDHHGQSGKVRLEDEDCTISMDSNFIQIKTIAKVRNFMYYFGDNGLIVLGAAFKRLYSVYLHYNTYAYEIWLLDLPMRILRVNLI